MDSRDPSLEGDRPADDKPTSKSSIYERLRIWQRTEGGAGNRGTQSQSQDILKGDPAGSAYSNLSDVEEDQASDREKPFSTLKQCASQQQYLEARICKRAAIA